MDIYESAVTLHLAAGTVALLTFWSAALTKKGSRLHIVVGRSYLAAMIVVLLTSAGLAAAFIAGGRPAIGTFLGYLVVITATACWLAWRAIRVKCSPDEYFGTGFRHLGWLNLAAGLLVFSIGLRLGIALLMIFCWVGIVGGAAMLRQAGRPPTANRRWWLREHYFNVLGMGVATHIAFLGLGLNRLLAPLGIQPPQMIAWTLPLAVAILAGFWLERRYGAARARAAPLRNAT